MSYGHALSRQDALPPHESPRPDPSPAGIWCAKSHRCRAGVDHIQTDVSGADNAVLQGEGRADVHGDTHAARHGFNRLCGGDDDARARDLGAQAS